MFDERALTILDSMQSCRLLTNIRNIIPIKTMKNVCLKDSVFLLGSLYWVDIELPETTVQIERKWTDTTRGVARISSRGGGESGKIIIKSKIYNLGKDDG